MAKFQHKARSSKRRLILHGARIAGVDNTPLESCRILDVSAGGARLQVKNPGGLPDQFILLLSRDGTVRRQCAVVWRSERAVGVEFVRALLKEPRN